MLVFVSLTTGLHGTILYNGFVKYISSTFTVLDTLRAYYLIVVNANATWLILNFDKAQSR